MNTAMPPGFAENPREALNRAFAAHLGVAGAVRAGVRRLAAYLALSDGDNWRRILAVSSFARSPRSISGRAPAAQAAACVRALGLLLAAISGASPARSIRSCGGGHLDADLLLRQLAAGCRGLDRLYLVLGSAAAQRLDGAARVSRRLVRDPQPHLFLYTLRA